MSHLPFSVKLMSLFQEGGDNNECIRLLQGGDGKGHLRVYLALYPTITSAVDKHIGVPRHSYEVKVLKIHSRASSVYADRLFNCSDSVLPLVKVKLCHSDTTISHHIIREIAQNGFTFLNEQYHFLAFKDLGTEFAYFFPQTCSGFRTSLSLWQSIGNFTNLSHVPVVGLRLGLLVSGACEGFTWGDISVLVVQDLHTCALQENKLSAGEGFYCYITFLLYIIYYIS